MKNYNWGTDERKENGMKLCYEDDHFGNPCKIVPGGALCIVCNGFIPDEEVKHASV